MRAALRSSIVALSLVFAGSALAAHGSAPAPRAHGSAGGGPVGVTAPQYRVTPAYAKRVIRSVAGDVTGQRAGAGRWDVSFSVPAHGPVGGPTSNFHAQWTWTGSGPHIALAVPDVQGSFNWQKAPGAPKGKARVNVSSPMVPFP